MATHQLLQTRQKKKSSKEAVLLPSRVTTREQSVVLLKRLLAIGMSCITYMRGLFPESSYGTRYLDDVCLKILREDKCCLGAKQVVKWIQGCFDALERQYLHIAVLTFYTDPKEPETVTELYQFKFKYKKEVPQMDIISNQVTLVDWVSSEDLKQSSRFLIRKLYLLLQNLGPLPNDVTLTMKLRYYSDVTPEDYQPPGFKEDVSPRDLFFDGDPVNLRVGSVSTGFHLMKMRVTTEKKRIATAESNMIQENGPTEISHRGLDSEEEEQEGSTKNHPLPVQADSSERGENKSDTHPHWKRESSSFHLQDTGKGPKTGVKGMGRIPCSRESQQISHLNLAFSQEEVIGPKKKRKVSEPEKLFLEGRK
ncbi:PREDICTED: HORMA domain-containing protein 2 [Merops nubicus]|uniref:HORMA domain-containing protein 2 n=1 Tax=Merops nubicus TaxID=57421 RepID=UPI0004F03830|nr:PREDICTED: HORMA domain-containing protein 2 [Merops nubicus]